MCAKRPGGTAGYVQRLITHLQNHNDFQTSFITFGENRLAQDLEKSAVPVYRISQSSNYDFSAISQLKKIVKRENIDIIHAHGYKAMIVGAFGSGDAKLMATIHGLTDTEHTVKRVRLYNKIAFWMLRWRADLVTSILPSDIKLFKNKIGKVPTIGTPNGVEIPNEDEISIWRKQYRQEFDLDIDDFAIGFVGRLVGRKGVDKLIIAFKEARRWAPWIKLFIAGDGREGPRLKQLTAELGLTKEIKFLGYRKDGKHIVAAFDLVVSTSSREGVPTNLLEAMACAVPVIGYQAPGVNWVLQDDELLIDFDHKTDLVKRMLDIIENPDFAQQLGDNLYTRAKHEFSQKRMFGIVEDAYRSLI